MARLQISGTSRMPKSFPIKAWISTSCLASMVKEARRCLPNETGGAFMGYWSDPSTVVITDVIGPGPSAKHSQHSFYPDVQYHDSEIERVYTASDRLHTYLGDWHTHPNGSARTSRKDRKTLSAIASDPGARAPQPIMAILAGNQDWKLVIWSWEGKDFLWLAKVVAANVISFDQVN
jgi:integrative and conjugative element protein (TIGR02256 family)